MGNVERQPSLGNEDRAEITANRSKRNFWERITELDFSDGCANLQLRFLNQYTYNVMLYKSHFSLKITTNTSIDIPHI